MATIRDVARLANVSPTTVSATLSGSAAVSEELKKRVMDAVHRANYQPDRNAQSLRRGVSTTIGLIVPDIVTPWASHLAKATQRSLSDRGYNMLLASNEDDSEREFRDIDLMISHRVAGLLIAPTSLGEGYAERFAASVSCPAVLVDRIVAPERFDVVVDDNRLGGRMLADYLLRCDHRRIGMLVGRAGISASDERFEAVSEALSTEGAPLSPDLTRHGIHTVDQAYSAVQELMTGPDRPTAIICISHHQGRGAMAGLKNMGLPVPDAVSVISFDGFNPDEGWHPSITSLVQDTATLSNLAVGRLLERIGGAADTAPDVMRVRPTLRVGESCATARR
ncbi:LacI family DNA-binding transcriptional regulator [Psychromarinibacter sp. C21-152]|uniref:LacI family DNA-binding transcriptional regulator n=1 Tax=Psychromarinibacter sediminicola TaxID=3033385 RepID=A0AAE3NVW7_9RHOB|nr:LacI family DNA-binding transcriptional regulator [Psychromarinibacter sediminicola]MDF0603102.1 LacI family DNA-binding transcriptional regulator [Psychromarinibacter sediminicola]